MKQRSNHTPAVKRGGKQISSKAKDPNLILRPAFQSQLVQQMTVEGIPQTISGAATSAIRYLVSSASISNFSTRFGDLFEEYRIIKVTWKVKFHSSTLPGLLVTWVDEKGLGIPTLAEAQRRAIAKNIVNLSRVNRDLTVAWTAHDPVDLGFLDTTGSPVDVAAFKLYTDASFGAPATGTLYTLFPMVTVQFRGLR